MMLRLGIDLDGCLADFEYGYLLKLQAASGGNLLLPFGEDPPCWDWATEVGYTREQDARAWDSIKGDAMFWATLRPMLGAQKALTVLAQLYHEGHEVYFITNRPGVASHMQSMVWLINMGFPTPTVLIAENKGPVVAGLKLTHFLDDKPSNLESALAEAPECKLFLLSHRYNEGEQPELAAKGVRVIKKLQEFFQGLVIDEVIEGFSQEQM